MIALPTEKGQEVDASPDEVFGPSWVKLPGDSQDALLTLLNEAREVKWLSDLLREIGNLIPGRPTSRGEKALGECINHCLDWSTQRIHEDVDRPAGI